MAGGGTLLKKIQMVDFSAKDSVEVKKKATTWESIRNRIDKENQ